MVFPVRFKCFLLGNLGGVHCEQRTAKQGWGKLIQIKGRDSVDAYTAIAART